MSIKTHQVDACANLGNDLLQRFADLAPDLNRFLLYVQTIELDDALVTTATEYAAFVADNDVNSVDEPDGDGGTRKRFAPSTGLRVDNDGNLNGPRIQKNLADYAEMLTFASQVSTFVSDPTRFAILQRQSVIK